MRVGVIGLGRLGFPMACAIASKGFQVVGYDNNPARLLSLARGECDRWEKGLYNTYQANQERIHFANGLQEIVDVAEIIFITVPTPSPKGMDGSVPTEGKTARFDLTYVKDVVKELNKLLATKAETKQVVIVSTLLPGDMTASIAPLWPAWQHHLTYSPALIALGTVIDDFLNAEFRIIGNCDRSGYKLFNFYRALQHDVPIHVTSWTEAEVVKMAYNAWVNVKVATTNAIALLCDKLPNCDAFSVSRILQDAGSRIVSKRYMTPGWPVGGPCLPRDLLALAWLGQELDLPYDFFGTLADMREAHVEYIAMLVERALDDDAALKDVNILGCDYKPNVPVSDGSCARLLHHQLWERGTKANIYMEAPPRFTEAAVFVIADPRFADFQFPRHSVIIDPIGVVLKKDGCKVVTVGARCT